MKIRLVITLVVSVTAVVAGCGGPKGAGSTMGPPSTAEALENARPHRIEILPFTKPKALNQDLVPSCIEVTLRTLDAMNDPVKAWGTFHFELSRYRPASGDPHGDALQSWTNSIGSIKQQGQYWDRVTQTYRFPLAWEGTPLEPQKKYVLDVSFNAPWGDRVYAEPYIFEFAPDLEGLKAKARARSHGRH